MANHDVSADASMVFETGAHNEAGKLAAAAVTPSRWTWRHFDDATLGPRFRDACERLERMLYAIHGSKPKSYSSFSQWYNRQHPRCLWGPEQSVARWDGTLDGEQNPNCNSTEPEYNHETAALGPITDPVAYASLPWVPIRSASGDPKAQMLDSSLGHARDVFPFGSISRDGDQLDWESHSTFDPRGTGDFGGPPATPGVGGELHIDGDAVEIRWTPPAAIAALVSAARITYTVGAGPGGTLQAMVQDGDDWVTETPIPAQNHNTTVYWTITATVDGVAVTDPLTGRYSYVAYTHWNPYSRGLPELWSVCKKGTDGYTFGPDECIQPALINLMRFLLDWIGAHFHHSPHVSDSSICCLRKPIKVRWSGGSPWPHYLAGGKSRSDNISPLHNLSGDLPESVVINFRSGSQLSVNGLPEGIAIGDCATISYGGASWHAVVSDFEEGGEDSFITLTDIDPDMPIILAYGTITVYTCSADPEQARRSWRGAGGYWRQATLGEGPLYGPGESWMSIPEYLEEEAYGSPTEGCALRWTGTDRGLWAGDVIHPSHIEEIIAAVDYFVNYGIWDLVAVKSRVMTPEYEVEGYTCSASACRDESNDPWEQPTWENCWSGSPPAGTPPEGICYLRLSDYDYSTWGWAPEYPLEGDIHSVTLTCTTNPGAENFRYQFGCKVHGYDNGSAGYGGSKECGRQAYGFAAWVCTPAQFPRGVDAVHGNESLSEGLKKRYSSGDLYTGEPVSYGNGFGELYSCGNRIDNGELTGEHNLPFESVVGVHLMPDCSPWFGYDCGIGEWVPTFQNCLTLPDPLEVLGSNGYFNESGTWVPLCSASCNLDEEELGADASGLLCEADLLEGCPQDQVWAAIDLQIGGAPYALYRDPDTGELTCTDEDRMPTLTDYASEPSAAAIAHANCATEEIALARLAVCPCGTWTGPASCEDTWCIQSV